jgi:hypothetical protein
MHKFLTILMVLLLLAPATAMATTVDDLQEQLDELSERLEKAERHAATDKISWYGDLRSNVHSLHYKDVTFNPGVKVDFTDFFMKVGGGALGALNVFDAMGAFNPALSQGSALDNMFVGLAQNDPDQFAGLMQAMGAMQQFGTMPGVGNFRLATAPRTYDINNDILYTTRMRLGMKAKVAENMTFAGRLSMFKNWGDSTGSKVFDSWNAFTMDGTNGGNTTGDFLRVERAYFNWKNIGDTNFYLSIGRRPSTYGSPSNYRENEMRGGTPTGHLVHFNFDGLTAGYKLSEVTGIEGQAVRFCYGQGFESEWGNGEMFKNATANLKDTHLGGFNIDLYNTGDTLAQLTLFTAQDVVDGFKGVFAFPTEYAALFAPTLYADMQKFPTFNFNTRYTPSAVIGDINLVGLNVAHTMENEITLFASAAMTQLKPSGEAGMFGGLGTDAVFEAVLSADGSEVYMMPVRAENNDTQEGYGVYVGLQTPAPMGKFGIEYNYGSEYWSPFTQAQDDALGSKLATRGHVGEAYYVFELNRKAFIKLSGIYYDYEYTGSGSPVGEPKKIEDVKNGLENSLMPVVDSAWDANLSFTFKF